MLEAIGDEANRRADDLALELASLQREGRTLRDEPNPGTDLHDTDNQATGYFLTMKALYQNIQTAWLLGATHGTT